MYAHCIDAFRTATTRSSLGARSCIHDVAAPATTATRLPDAVALPFPLPPLHRPLAAAITLPLMSSLLLTTCCCCCTTAHAITPAALLLKPAPSHKQYPSSFVWSCLSALTCHK
ncbi:hypothetical protein PC116_g16838 [Phytophthora cactorum]|nr:hypothetical protein C6341_g19903 [Phytophthora cactorum]KAG4235021.1 hypothetical protein PC116_g16838 [Phytophthora cactorum]